MAYSARERKAASAGMLSLYIQRWTGMATAIKRRMALLLSTLC